MYETDYLKLKVAEENESISFESVYEKLAAGDTVFSGGRQVQ